MRDLGAAVAAAIVWAAASVGFSGPAAAQVPSFIDEFKVGLLEHDITLGGHHVEGGQDVSIEALFTSPTLLSILGSPRPHFGADINDEGNTSDIYGGLTWGYTLLHGVFSPVDGIFVNGSLGGALQDGYEDSAPPGRKRLGSPILFRESVELGYQITPLVSVSAFVDHISNADLAPRNAGITSAGGRLGFKF